MTTTPRHSRLARSVAAVLALSAGIALAGCGDIDVENLNGTSIEGLQTNPTPSAVNSAAQGLMAAWRSTSTGNAQTLTKYGFEIWQIRASNPPSLTQIVSFPQCLPFSMRTWHKHTTRSESCWIFRPIR